MGSSFDSRWLDSLVLRCVSEKDPGEAGEKYSFICVRVSTYLIVSICNSR